MNSGRAFVAYMILLALVGTLLCLRIDAVASRPETVTLPETVTPEIAVLSDETEPVEQTHVDAVERGAEEREMVSLGVFRITYYTNSIECCGKKDGVTRSGAIARSNHTIAVDPEVIPLGSEVMIGGTVYTAEDIGGAVKGKVIDIYVDDLNAERPFDAGEMEVFVVN